MRSQVALQACDEGSGTQLLSSTRAVGKQACAREAWMLTLERHTISTCSEIICSPLLLSQLLGLIREAADRLWPAVTGCGQFHEPCPGASSILDALLTLGTCGL